MQHIKATNIQQGLPVAETAKEGNHGNYADCHANKHSYPTYAAIKKSI